MTDYHIIVLDIGKTNKKCYVYDSAFQCRNSDEKGVVFPPIQRDGLLCDDMAAIYHWMMTALRRAAEQYRDIRVISVSAHGATIALLGDGQGTQFPGDGGLTFPIVSYEQEMNAADEKAFYRAMGMTPDEMQERTGTARFGWLLNHGKQVFLLKRRFPQRFAKVASILMFPQYLTYLLTGERAIEPTYIGCHGYLLDITGKRYSDVAERLGIADKLPALPMRPPWAPLATIRADIAQETGLPADCLVTVGVHDSNAALVPYFVSVRQTQGESRSFVVQDSGTWIVTMCPREKAVFARDELGKEVFYNWSIYGRPVKTTIFRGGAEFEFYRRSMLAGRPHPQALDLRLLTEIAEAKEAFCLPTVERGTGLFPQSVPRLEATDTIFRDAATAWCVVDLGLAVQGWLAIRMAAGSRVRSIAIEGNVGRMNPVYRSVISTVFPEARVAYGSLGGAAYGAAILGAAAVEGVRPEALAGRVRPSLEEVPKLDLDPAVLRAYADAFIQRLM